MTPERFVIGAWIVWFASWLLAAGWRARAVKRPGSGQQIAYRLLTALGALLLFGFRLRDLHLWKLDDAAAWTLSAVTILGLLFTWWARIHLGRLWSSSVTRKADHHVVDTGPYRIVRHPIYTGILAAAIATGILRGSVSSLLGTAVLILGLFIKARLEESFLRAELGSAYDDYARRVSMLVPWPHGRGRQ